MIIKAPQRGAPKKNSQPMQMKALPSSEMKRRSPLVVSMEKTPCRGAPPGTARSHIAMQPMAKAMNMKNTMVILVHAIHVPSGSIHHLKLKSIGSSMAFPSNSAEGKALGEVVSDEINDNCARYNRECSSRCEQSQFIARG